MSTPPTWEREPRLVLRFAAYTAGVLLLASTAILLFVRDSATDRAQEAAAFHARFVADTVLRRELRPSDLERPVAGERLAELERMLEREVLVSGAVRLKLYSPDGLVTYSTDHAQIGRRVSGNGSVRDALEGGAPSSVTTLDAEDGEGEPMKVLEAYVPIHLGGGTPAGVLELYQDYAPIAKAAREAFVPVAIALALTLVALYVSLFPILRRVTRRLHRQMEEIEHQALHDALTGLPNRLLFADRVQQALLAAPRDGDRLAVMMIDLDRFKEVNDTLGHQSGDLLLKQLGPRLARLLRAADTVARLGGDEFAVLLPKVSDARGALAVAKRLQQALEEPFEVGGLVLEVEASIGIALYPDHGTDVETLMRRADLAMYVAKEQHGGAALYDEHHDHYSPERLTLVAELRQALQKRELALYFQPKASLRDGSVDTVEALVRWHHPKRGLLPPVEFLPLAEHTGLIRPLTQYVLEAALRQCRDWQDEGLSLGVAVNLSARDLLDVGLPDEVSGLLERFGVPPQKLELEITESTILIDPARALDVLTRLSKVGVRLAIDDFGSGYSSLGYLKRLPMDVLKIDKSFVMQMTADANDAVIVRSTIDLGHNLGLTVVAEGVEGAQALDELASLGCDAAQGYHLGRPVPAHRVAEELSHARELTRRLTRAETPSELRLVEQL